MPRRALKTVFDWLEIHKDELHEDWELANNTLSASTAYSL